MKLLLLYTFLFLYLLQIQSQELDTIQYCRKKAPFNLSIIGQISTNGHCYEDITNNVSLGLFHAGAKNIYGFSLAPINLVDSAMHGLQLGTCIGAEDIKGVQIGFFTGARKNLKGVQIGAGNFVKDLKGMQVGFFNKVNDLNGVQMGFVNRTESSKGVQIGIANWRKNNGLQIGFINISKNNDYPIGFINIVKNGDMNIGMYTDEMSNIITTFRSGGRYFYGIAGLGISLSSSSKHMVIEGGIGVHLHFSKWFRLDTEITVSDFERAMAPRWGESEEEMKERSKNHEYRQAFRASIRMFPNIRLGKHIEIFGGPSVNYLHSNNARNETIFPSNYWWRSFRSSCFKQVYLGWIAGAQYRF